MEQSAGERHEFPAVTSASIIQAILSLTRMPIKGYLGALNRDYEITGEIWQQTNVHEFQNSLRYSMSVCLSESKQQQLMKLLWASFGLFLG